MANLKTLLVRGIKIATIKQDGEDFISLTDIARNKNPDEPKDVVKNWMRSKSTIQFLGLWEQLNNSDFKGVEFDPFEKEAGSNSFTLSPTKWVEVTNAKGLLLKNGKNGGTFARKDIAFEFASWVSPEFKLYLITEFQRLKKDENSRLKQDWNLQRTLAKVNYKIHTDAIKETLVPQALIKNQIHQVYANEADLLNVAMFGVTAREWRDNNVGESGNVRDSATLEQLIILSNLESINSVLIQQGLQSAERVIQLNAIAIKQMKSLLKNDALKKLK
jgi:hypothetical protein